MELKRSAALNCKNTERKLEIPPIIHNLIFIGIVIFGLLCFLLLAPGYKSKDEE